MSCLPCCCARFVAGGGGDNQAEANKQRLKEACVCVTTFNMIAHKGKRSAYGEEVGLRNAAAVGTCMQGALQLQPSGLASEPLHASLAGMAHVSNAQLPCQQAVSLCDGYVLAGPAADDAPVVQPRVGPAGAG